MITKRLIILLIILIASITIFFYDGYGDKLLPVKLDKEKNRDG